jgi:putative flippase GtrA
MRNNSLLGESSISLLLIILLVLCWNPGGRLWMPSMAMSLVLLGLIIAFLVFAAFVWKERARDEREEHHRLISGRVSFLCGAAVLVTGIVVETFQGKTDFWLLAALAVMVLAKLAARVWSEMLG